MPLFPLEGNSLSNADRALFFSPWPVEVCELHWRTPITPDNPGLETKEMHGKHVCFVSVEESSTGLWCEVLLDEAKPLKKEHRCVHGST